MPYFVQQCLTVYKYFNVVFAHFFLTDILEPIVQAVLPSSVHKDLGGSERLWPARCPPAMNGEFSSHSGLLTRLP